MESRAPAPRVTLMQLAWTFGSIMSFAFGGSVNALIRRAVCGQRGWLTEPEFLEIYGIAQISPGSIPVSIACLIGRRLAGTPGFFVSLFAATIPGFMILMTLAVLSMGPHAEVLRAGLRGAAAAATGLLIGNAIQLTFPFRRKPIHLALVVAAACSVLVLHLQLVVTLLVLVPCAMLAFRLARER